MGALNEAIDILDADAAAIDNADVIVLVTDGANGNDAADCAPCTDGTCGGNDIPLVVLTVGPGAALKPCYLNGSGDNKVPVTDFDAL